MSNTTCPCGNPIILEGIVVKAHWEGKVCQDCESEMFKKYEARFQKALGAPPPSPTQETAVTVSSSVLLYLKLKESVETFAMLRQEPWFSGVELAELMTLAASAKDESNWLRAQRDKAESATPSSQETPAELTEALADYDLAFEELFAALVKGDSGDPGREKLAAARSALLALYTRQREEIEQGNDLISGLIRENERLKADSLTPEEAQYIAYHLYGDDLGETVKPAEVDSDVEKTTYAKIRRRLSSDSGTGGEK